MICCMQLNLSPVCDTFVILLIHSFVVSRHCFTLSLLCHLIFLPPKSGLITKEKPSRKETTFFNLDAQVCAVDCNGKFLCFSTEMWKVRKKKKSEIVVKEKPIRTTEFLQRIILVSQFRVSLITVDYAKMATRNIVTHFFSNVSFICLPIRPTPILAC